MKNKKIKALGFVEVLISIVVVGIVSAVFLTIAGKTMKSLIQTERIEQMARIAVDGSNIAQEIANQEKAQLTGGEDLFPSENPGDIGSCFIPEYNPDTSEYSFKSELGSGMIQIPDDNRTEFVKNPSSMYENYFLVMCIEGIDDSGTSWASVKFVVGDIKVAGVQTTDSDVRDFTYYSIIDL